jgi:hypothetical protein
MTRRVAADIGTSPYAAGRPIQMSRKARNPACSGDIIEDHDVRAKNRPTMRLTRELVPYFGASAVGLALDVSLL